jgi:hypothetical protein
MYRISVEGVAIDYTSVIETQTCRAQFDRIQELGTYRVTVAAQTQRGWSLPATEEIDRVDWLVVALGDSLASGEGNPDEPGQYFLPPWSDEDPQNTPVRCEDRRCHRSARSGPAQAAEQLEERDPHSSANVLEESYAGQERGPNDIPSSSSHSSTS